MECILAINIEDIELDTNWNELIDLCSADKRSRIEKCRLVDDQKRILCGELLIKYYFIKYLHLDVDLQYVYNQNHKPQLVKSHGIHFNISHSGKWVVCGFGYNELGIDIEKIHEVSVNLSKKCFNEEEEGYIFAKGQAEYAERFTQMWTMKESYVKYQGVGLGYGLKNFSIDHSDHTIIDDKLEKNVYLYCCKFAEEYYISYCADKKSEVDICIVRMEDIVKTCTSHMDNKL